MKNCSFLDPKDLAQGPQEVAQSARTIPNEVEVISLNLLPLSYVNMSKKKKKKKVLCSSDN